MEKKELNEQLKEVVNEFVEQGYDREYIIKKSIKHLEVQLNVIS